MAVTAYLFDNFLLRALKGEVDLDTATLKCMLTTSTYVPDQAAHVVRSSVTNEVTGTGYTAGGATLATVAVSLASHIIKIDADNVSWPNSTITARYAVVYVSTGVAANDILIGFVDFGENLSSTAANFNINWDNTLGIVSHTVGSPT